MSNLRSLFLVLATLGVCGGGRLAMADEARQARLFFRTPDPETMRLIEEYSSTNGFAAGTRGSRREARRNLFEIGAWSVPPLMRLLHGSGRTKNARRRMNGVLTLARILDEQSLPTLRAVAREDSSAETRQAACLALGLFREEQSENAQVLRDLLAARELRTSFHRAAPLALGRIPVPEAGITLRRLLDDPPADDRVTAALLLGATVRTPVTRPQGFLKHDEKELRAVAAVCLQLRPLGVQEFDLLAKALRKPREDRDVRRFLYFALAAMDRGAPQRELLLKCATSANAKEGPRVAAVTGLAYERGVVAHYAPLRAAWRPLQRRNDKVAAALLHAMLQTGDPDAVDTVLRSLKFGSPLMRFYAAGALLFQISLADPMRPHPRERDILKAIEPLQKTRDPLLRSLVEFARKLKFKKVGDERVTFAREQFASDELADPYGLHLWDWDARARAWALANRMIGVIFKLDDIADKGDPFSRDEDSPLQKDANRGNTRALKETPEEQDLIEFLREEPYFGPEDLGDR